MLWRLPCTKNRYSFSGFQQSFLNMLEIIKTWSHNSPMFFPSHASIIEAITDRNSLELYHMGQTKAVGLSGTRLSIYALGLLKAEALNESTTPFPSSA